MGTYYIDQLDGSQLRDANEANPTAENGSLTNWPIGDSFVLCTGISYNTCNKATVLCQLKLQFAIDGGAFNDVGPTTEISFDATTTLVDGDPSVQRITTSINLNCTSGFLAGYECEGDNLPPVYATGLGNYSEFHWALNTANAVASSVYTFRVVNVTDGNTPLINDSASSITMSSGGSTITLLAAAVATTSTTDTSILSITDKL